MVTGPEGIQRLSQGCKEGPLSSVGQLQASLTASLHTTFRDTRQEHLTSFPTSGAAGG